MKRQIGLLWMVIIFLSGCGSSPTVRQYILQPTVSERVSSEQTGSEQASSETITSETTTSATAQPLNSAATNSAVGIGPVTVAEFLHGMAIVTSSDGYQLQAAELEQWGEPLTDGITRVVAENIAALTGNDKVRVFPWRGDEQPALALKIEVLNLNASNNLAVLKLRWALRQTGVKQPLDEGYSHYEQSLESLSYANIARGYSDLLTLFSRDMAVKIQGVNLGPVQAQ